MEPGHESTVVFFACAWCEVSLGVLPVAWTGRETETTHGLCDGCRRQMRARRDPERVGAVRVSWRPGLGTR